MNEGPSGEGQSDQPCGGGGAGQCPIKYRGGERLLSGSRIVVLFPLYLPPYAMSYPSAPARGMHRTLCANYIHSMFETPPRLLWIEPLYGFPTAPVSQIANQVVSNDMDDQ